MFLITLILGLVFILIGAHLLTDGASALAQKFKVSNLVIGLTVVAFGTSAPELSVSAMAALKGSADMAIGNVVGSNLFNTLLIIGCTALIAPIRISKSTLLKEIPLCILAAAVLWVTANDQLLAGAKTNTLNRIEGLLFLGFLTIFISHTFTIARNSDSSTDNETAPITKMCTLKAGSYIIIGLAGLIFGGQWFIEGATIVARLLGLSESTIALTLVAGGTSFPELATSIVAAKKNNPEMAIGNAIGSNLFNIRYFADGVIHLNVGGNGWHETASAPGTIQNGQWNHIAVVANSWHQVLYVNGQKVCEQNQTYGVPDPGFDFAIGNTGVWTDRAVNAMVKNLRIWSVERTESQIQATMDQEVDLATTGLEVYFPFTADLGTEFVDATGKFKAKLKGDVAWQENGTPPVIVLEKDALTAAITEVTTFKDGLTEGMNNGDYPVGTKVYLQELIDTANDMLTDADRQSQLDDMVSKIKKAIKLVKANTVAPAEGVYIDRDDADAVGLRITPNYAPAGDFTVELDLRAKTLMMGPNGNNGGIFGAGEYGMFLWGYDELTEEKVLAAGQIGNYNHWDGSPEWWMWVKSGPGVIKSGQWHHVALVHDDTAMTNTIYVDGVQVAQEMNFKVPNPSGGAEIWLGNYWAKINGSIKDFRFWDEVRTPAQLNADITGSEANLRMYFPLDKVAGVKFDAKTGAYKAEIRGIKWNVTSSSN
jgi:K+-dependent Na+/Ca+ exchanger-like protein